MKQGVMPCLAPRDLTMYLRFFKLDYILLVNGEKGGIVIWNRAMEMNVLKQGGFVTHLRNLAVLESLSQSACTRAMKQ